MRFRLTLDSNGRTIWIADAHRDDGRRFVVRADDMLTAFLELETAIHQIHQPRLVYADRIPASAFYLQSITIIPIITTTAIHAAHMT